jgi:hypothetical protein
VPSENPLIFIAIRTCTVVGIRGFFTVCNWRIS